LVQGIVDLRKQRFLRDCKDYLKTGNITDSLSVDIINSSPAHIEYLKKGLSPDNIKVVNSAIERIKKLYQKQLSSNRQKVNMVASTVLENLSTLDKRFEIKEVMERYRETINPIKALYYDLQEIMFLYDGKGKKEHHKFLISKFSKQENFEEILIAVDKDIYDLHECKMRLKTIKEYYGVNSNSEYARKVTDLHSEMQQWKKLFQRFPEWVDENKDDNSSRSLVETLKDFFS
jgi:hypothetical protein